MSSSSVNIKPRLSATFPMSDASPAFEDDDDKNEKASKSSRKLLIRSVIFMSIFFVAAVSIGQYLDQQTELLASQKQKQQAAVESAAVVDTTNIFWETDDKLAKAVHDLDKKVRARKATKGIMMEVDPEGMELTKALQEATLKLLKHRYGNEHFRIRVDITYPESIKKASPKSDHFTIETAPIDLIPCSVFYFLEIARTYQSGSFHRNAGHVLQAQAQSAASKGHKSMPFQEYSDEHPHAKYTIGYAGRPSGPGWYVSTQDNTRNHGPGSQQKVCASPLFLFAKIIPSMAHIRPPCSPLFFQGESTRG